MTTIGGSSVAHACLLLSACAQVQAINNTLFVERAQEIMEQYIDVGQCIERYVGIDLEQFWDKGAKLVIRDAWFGILSSSAENDRLYEAWTDFQDTISRMLVIANIPAGDVAECEAILEEYIMRNANVREGILFESEAFARMLVVSAGSLLMKGVMFDACKKVSDHITDIRMKSYKPVGI